MTLKNRFALLFSLFFTLFFAVVLFIVYTLFSEYRQGDFYSRLVSKSEQIFFEIGKHFKNTNDPITDEVVQTTYKLVNERIAVFDLNRKQILQTNHTNQILLTQQQINSLRGLNTIYFNDNEIETIVKLFVKGNERIIVAVSAEDLYGNAKLDYLKILFYWTFVFGLILLWFFSYQLSRRALLPMDRLREKVQEITFQNLNNPIQFENKKDEISALAKAFNHMLERIDRAYKRQREFTGNASHELRTPIARIGTQIENLLQEKQIDENLKNSLKSVNEDVYHLSDVVTSLLILSRLDEGFKIDNFKTVRIDEIIFDVSDRLIKIWPDFKMQFEIENSTKEELILDVKGDETLLKIAITNLLKNAYTYSDNKQVKVTYVLTENRQVIQVFNTGSVPEFKDNSPMFQAFSRGSNSYDKPGSGLGLRIVQRILSYHNASITFTSPGENKNLLEVRFKR
jgi:signal transduction histidine kinase